MRLIIHNCNNIIDGSTEIAEGALNIKYAINGTGKSTIAKAVRASVEKDAVAIRQLRPYCYQLDDDHQPGVEGISAISKVMVFDEAYINQYVYQSDELLKNSFEIFVKTPKYDQHMGQIRQLLIDINRTFQEDQELDNLIQVFSQYIDGCGKSKTGLAASGAIVKGLGKGNKINNIPDGLEAYAPYLTNTKNAGNVGWLKWQADGRKYLDIADQCPYCSGSLENTRDKIIRISKEYDSKAIEHLDRMLLLFDQMKPYLSDTTNDKILQIRDHAADMSAQHRNYLFAIKQQIEDMLNQLTALKQIGFQSLKDVDKVTIALEKYKIDSELYSHLQSPLMLDIIKSINNSLDVVLDKAGKLQGEINQQNKLIRDTINDNSATINDFMQCAGYQYTISIKVGENGAYRTLLMPAGRNSEIRSVKDHLSYGERNALALALFMFSALKEDPDMIILDDPISSFDGNKKFSLLHMLFMSDRCLRNRTVLLLTHDFNSVIDIIHTMPRKFNPAPHACFLDTRDGILTETIISKSDIQSYYQIAMNHIASEIDTLNKLIYLRRLLEVKGDKGDSWQLLSNLFHKRETPINQYDDREMKDAEIADATAEIRKYVPTFDYGVEFNKTQDRDLLKELYHNSKSNYEKLQIYRILYDNNSDNPVVKKFVNETYHVENDYLFQLDPHKYDTIPQYIIAECDRDIENNELFRHGS